MTDEVCEGCGVPLQSDQPSAPGYVPDHIARRGDQVVCRRCYRINHYGKEEEAINLDDENTWSTVFDVASHVDACIMVVDLVDFEGSFVPELAESAGGRLLVAANKVDLLPSKTPAEEVAGWVAERLEARSLRSKGIYPVSALGGYGVRVLFDAARKVAGKGGKLGLVGATNVGKSTLLSRWLRGTRAEGPTVSRFPGTTVGVVERELGGADLEILDTPGLLTRGRLTDILCHECAAKLVPEAPLASKLIRLTPGHSVILGGLAALTPLDDSTDETVVLAFAAGDVPIHRVKRDKLDRWLEGDLTSGKTLLCDPCRNSLAKDGWEQVITAVGEMEDVAIHGLGWFSPRRNGLRARVTVPAGAMVSARPRLIGPKTPVVSGHRR